MILKIFLTLLSSQFNKYNFIDTNQYPNYAIIFFHTYIEFVSDKFKDKTPPLGQHIINTYISFNSIQ